MNLITRSLTAALVLAVVLAVPAERAPARSLFRADAARLVTGRDEAPRRGGGPPVARGASRRRRHARAHSGGQRVVSQPALVARRRRIAVDRLALRAGALERLEIVDAADGRVVATFDGRSASWSPDGRRIAYVQSGPGGSPSIAIADADGGGVRVIGRGANPAWRPDGSAIAFERDYTVRTIGVDGTGAVVSVPARARCGRPTALCLPSSPPMQPTSCVLTPRSSGGCLRARRSRGSRAAGSRSGCETGRQLCPSPRSLERPLADLRLAIAGRTATGRLAGRGLHRAPLRHFARRSGCSAARARLASVRRPQRQLPRRHRSGRPDGGHRSARRAVPRRGRRRRPLRAG